MVRDKKTTTITASAILARGKLLLASTKSILPESGQDVKVKKI